MRKFSSTSLAAIAIALPSAALAQSLTTGVQNNGLSNNGGIFLDLTPAGAPLSITSIDFYSSAAAGNAITVEVYTKAGTYVGSDTTAGAWTLFATINGTSNGSAVTTNLALPAPGLQVEGTTGVYLLGTVGGVRYSGTGSAVQTDWSNAELSLFSSLARSAPFAGSANTPRCFAGTINYDPADPTALGGCCFNDGTCTDLTFADCTAQSGAWKGSTALCAGTANCPQPGACCFGDGVCSPLLETVCLAGNGIWQGGGVACSGQCPTLPAGACCLPDSTCVTTWQSQCAFQSGLYQGDGIACGAGVCTFFFEVEPNNTKGEANVYTVSHGYSLRGVSTGTTATAGSTLITTVDYFRVKTTPAAPGVYRHRLILTSPTPTNSAWIRGLTQTAAAAGPWTGTVGTASSSESAGQTHMVRIDDRVNTWYGFGKEEEIYYRVAGATTSTADYTATLETTPITPTDLGTFNAGAITIDTGGQGHTNDTHVRIFDDHFDPIHGYANDGASIDGGAPANLTTTSFLRREFAAGTYYMGIAITNMATSHGSPSDDNVRSGVMMDFPGVAVDTGTLTVTDVSFSITDSDGTTPFPASRDGRGEIAWFKFTVAGTITEGACCFGDGTCAVLTAINCATQEGIYSGDGTSCSPNNCPQAGACCFTFGCVIRVPGLCAAAGGTFLGEGSVCSACPPFVQDRLIAVDSTRALYEVDRITGAKTQIGTVSANAGTTAGLAYDRATGTLYLASTSNDSLFTLNPDTGDATLVGGFTSSVVMHGIEYDDSTGTLYGGSNGNLFTIDKVTGAATQVGASGLTSFQNLGYNSDTDVLYSTNSGTDSLYIADRVTGAMTLVGTLNGPANPHGLAYDTAAGVMYLTCTTTDNLYRIDLQTGAATLVGFMGAGNLLGLVYIPDASAPAPCYANCDGSTTVPVLNVADFTCFLQKFAAGESYANCDQSTTIPTLNVADFTCFLQKFAAGCP